MNVYFNILTPDPLKEELIFISEIFRSPYRGFRGQKPIRNEVSI